MCLISQTAPAEAEGGNEIPTTKIKENSNGSWTVLSAITSKAAVPTIGMLMAYGSISPTQALASKITPTALDILTQPVVHLPAMLSQVALGVSYSATDLLTGTFGSLAETCSPAGWRQQAIAGPVAEEIVFRWGLQDKMLKPAVNWALKKYGPELSPKTRQTAAAVTAILVASALFASSHHVAGSTGISQDWTQRFLRGIIYGSLEEIDGLGSAALAHIVHNHVIRGRICA